MLAKVWLAGLCSTCRPGAVCEDEGEPLPHGKVGNCEVMGGENGKCALKLPPMRPPGRSGYPVIFWDDRRCLQRDLR